jgi:general secretion pathway protein F
MAHFEYLARDKTGAKLKGALDAASVDDASRKLAAKGLYPVSIKPVKARQGGAGAKEAAITVFEDLGGLLSSGVTVDRGLALMAAGETNKGTKAVILDMLERVQKGQNLSEAVASYPDLFGDLAPHLLRAGESSGKIQLILPWITEYLRELHNFRKRLISSLIYPAILLAMSAVSVVVLLVYVMPKFGQIFKDLNQEPPAVTKALLAIGEALSDWGFLLPIAFAAFWWGGKAVFKDPRVRAALDRLWLKLPVARDLILHSDLNRFCSTFGIMLQSGVPMLTSIRLAENVLGNATIREKIAPLAREVKAGRPVSGFFRQIDMFPPRLGSMMHIAEEQGRLAEGLVKLGEHYRGEFQQNLSRIVTMAEPLVIIVTGMIIGLLVISMFTAIFGVNEIGT